MVLEPRGDHRHVLGALDHARGEVGDRSVPEIDQLGSHVESGLDLFHRGGRDRHRGVCWKVLELQVRLRCRHHLEMGVADAVDDDRRDLDFAARVGIGVADAVP